MIDDIAWISAAGVSAPAGHSSHATAWNGLVVASAVKRRPEAEMIAAGKEHQRAMVAIIAVRDFGDEQRVVTDVEMPYHLAGEERDIAGKSWQTVDDVMVRARAGRRAARKMLRKSSTTFGQHVHAIAAARRNRLVHLSGHDGDEHGRRLETDSDKTVRRHAAGFALFVEGGQYRDTRDEARRSLAKDGRVDA